MSNEKTCKTCEFYSQVCMGHGNRKDTGESTYGMPIQEAEKMFPTGCEDWGLSFLAFQSKN